MSSNAMRKSSANNKRKLRLGYAFFIIFFVVLAAMAMIVNITMARQHVMKRGERMASSLSSPSLSSSSSFKKDHNNNNNNNNNNNFPKPITPMTPKTEQQQEGGGFKMSHEEILLHKLAEKEAAEAEQQILVRKGKPEEIHQPKGNVVVKQQQPQDSSTSTVHVVFSTSCHVKQDWQSYVFFYSAMATNQQGTVTRVVSGCSPEQEIEMTQVFEEQIMIMSDNFRLHFTPEFGRVPGKSYQSTKYWNKPFSLRHWLEHVFGYDMEQKNKILSTPLDDDIIVLVDPDMLMQRPFVNHFPPYMKDLWIAPIRNKHANTIYDKVSHGKPMAQDYSFGSAWLISSESNLTHVVGPDSPVHGVSDEDARIYYSAGPPYIATAKDMYQIAYYWTKFLPRIFDLFPKFMAEMYGYCMAAAHLQLKHQLAQGFMVSNVFFRHAEGWSFLDDVTDNACDITQFQEKVPQVIHFCQRYSIGEYFLSKYKLPVDILSCDFPLLELPPVDIAATTNYSHYGDGSVTIWEGNDKNFLYRNAYMVCSLMPAINKAATFYKDHNCPMGEANYEQTWNTFKAEAAEEAAAAAAAAEGK